MKSLSHAKTAKQSKSLRRKVFAEFRFGRDLGERLTAACVEEEKQILAWMGGMDRIKRAGELVLKISPDSVFVRRIPLLFAEFRFGVVRLTAEQVKGKQLLTWLGMDIQDEKSG